MNSTTSPLVAARQEWAIARGQEHEATAHQQAVLVYVAFRVGIDNKCYWPLDKIGEQVRMHKNTVSKCLRWWVKEGVLKGTAQLRGPTIYELAQYPSTSDIEIESNITPEVTLYPSRSDAISLQECAKGTIKKLERNTPPEHRLTIHPKALSP